MKRVRFNASSITVKESQVGDRFEDVAEVYVVYIFVKRARLDNPKGVNTMGGMEMTEKEQIAILIDQFTDLQRIKAASDKEKEIDYQIRTTKAKLEAMGIVTEDLII